MERKVIINADDFGLCQGVNKGIVEAHINGILTSATIMANMPWAEDAVSLAKQLPNLGTGIHLNLSMGSPLSNGAKIDYLVDSAGLFKCSAAKLSILSATSIKARKAIFSELSAQVQWVIDKGLKPTHLDSHKHIHSFPTMFPLVCKLAHKFGIPAIRWTYEPKAVCRMPWPVHSDGGLNRARTLRIMAKINRLQNSKLLKTSALLGIAHTGKINVDFFRAVVLYGSVATVEVMTHPGFTNGIDRNQTRLVEQRKVELERTLQ